MARQLDPVEQDYERAMRMARDTDEAFELSIGLKQYREMFKVDSCYLEPTDYSGRDHVAQVQLQPGREQLRGDGGVSHVQLLRRQLLHARVHRGRHQPGCR